MAPYGSTVDRSKRQFFEGKNFSTDKSIRNSWRILYKTLRKKSIFKRSKRADSMICPCYRAPDGRFLILRRAVRQAGSAQAAGTRVGERDRCRARHCQKATGHGSSQIRICFWILGWTWLEGLKSQVQPVAFFRSADVRWRIRWRYLSKPSARRAAWTAGRSPMRTMKALRLARAEISMPTCLHQPATTNR